MTLLYLDCLAGISGDMLLGALLDLGLPQKSLRAELAKLHLPGYRLAVRRVTKQSISATKFDCVAKGATLQRGAAATRHREQRGYREIAKLIEASKLSRLVRRRALAVFRRLGEAEAKIHGIPLQQVHFHEIGALDSIVDIVGACVALEILNVDEVQASPPPLGSGMVETAHGRFPVPAPATLELLKGVPTRPGLEPTELVTPTGAALLAEFCTRFGPPPAMTIQGVGYGAGTRDLKTVPNVLRAVVGETGEIMSKRKIRIRSERESQKEEADTVTVIETNVDDMSPQWLGEVMERVLDEGALDAFFTAVQMKKNRPGTLLTVLCDSSEANRLAGVILTHTTSFGVRMHEVRRLKLAREITTVSTRFGDIEVKIGRRQGKTLARSPEYESCREAAARYAVPVREVWTAAMRAAEEIS